MYDSQFGLGRVVLVVDDQPDFCEAMEQLLQTLGFRVACAANGAEALAKLQAQRVAVMLTDMFMPIMDGLELLRRLKEAVKPLPPIIAMTGDARVAAESVAKAAAILGAKAVLMKPFSRDQLAGAIAFVCADAKQRTGRDS
jgi:two-component system, NarL family, sensor histidine kinase EvgS